MTPATFSHDGFFDALLDAAVDAIIIIDQAGGIQRFNHSAQTMFGYSEDEVLQRNVNILMPEPARGRHDGYLGRYLETGKAAIIGIGRIERGMRKSGEIFPMRLSVGESRRRGQVHFVGIIHDLSEQNATDQKLKILEQQLFHADRLLTLGELTAGIAHEINQPLTAIAAYADAARHLVEKQPERMDPAVRGICARISDQSRRAAAVVERLRKLVRSGTTRKASHDIRNIIKSTLLLFDYEIKKTGIFIQVKAPDELPEVYADEIQIQQILVNLVKNSMDSLTDSGQLDGRVSISVSHTNNDLVVSVRDNGPGVLAESLPRLFEPFYTSKPQGVGLGLSICKHIAVAHAGTLSFVPQTEQGAQFVLKLPLSSIG
ncbi:MAG TPA: PAS domain S-box protein [Xanthomonadales bacterium]|nr:PAS domain S-box protein [Xanthomonadales bacterium]